MNRAELCHVSAAILYQNVSGEGVRCGVLSAAQIATIATPPLALPWRAAAVRYSSFVRCCRVFSHLCLQSCVLSCERIMRGLQLFCCRLSLALGCGCSCQLLLHGLQFCNCRCMLTARLILVCLQCSTCILVSATYSRLLASLATSHHDMRTSYRYCTQAYKQDKLNHAGNTHVSAHVAHAGTPTLYCSSCFCSSACLAWCSCASLASCCCAASMRLVLSFSSLSSSMTLSRLLDSSCCKLALSAVSAATEASAASRSARVCSNNTTGARTR